jgi:hypothetical protein
VTIGLDQTATVYGTGASGRFDHVLRPELRCRVVHLRINSAPGGNERAELAQLRRFLWDPAYELPENTQVEVDGVRYKPVRGTFAALRGPAGKVTVRAADAVRQSS